MKVVEHPAFASLYLQELAQEGLPTEIFDIDRIPATTISIYPDEARKDVNALRTEIPALSGSTLRRNQASTSGIYVVLRRKIIQEKRLTFRWEHVFIRS